MATYGMARGARLLSATLLENGPEIPCLDYLPDCPRALAPRLFGSVAPAMGSVYRVRAQESNLAFFVHRRDAVGRHITKYGAHEADLTRWIAHRLAAVEPALFVDVGANVGWHALHAALCKWVETVVAFEPDPFNAWLLDRNLMENGIDNVIVSCSALGTQRGQARLYRYKASNRGRHSLAADHGHGSKMVPVLDLDSALDDLGFGDRRVAILKIDVEGYEPAVIAGARATLARTEAAILEYTPALSQRSGLSAQAMIATLHAGGFLPFALQANAATAPIDVEELRNFDGQKDIIWLR
jgi:FkbM family methyltransferase